MNFDTFCMSPFVRMTQWWQGNLNTCTHYGEMTGDGTYSEKQVFIPKDKYNTLIEAFDGEEMRNLRQKMIDGEFLEGCRYCYHLESLGLMSLRQSINSCHDLKPVSKLKEIEIYPSNKCNFRCTICNPSASSVWENTPLQIADDKPQKTYLLDDLEDLDLITISGGEPMIMEDYSGDFFEGRSAKLFTMATNNSVFPRLEFFNFVNRCDNVLIYLSLDGVGEVGEFCRKGLKISRFERNLKKWKDWFDQSKFERNGNPDYKLRPPYLTGLRIMFVMQTYNIFNIYDSMKWAEENDIILDLRNCYSPEKLNVAYLPDDIKNDIMQMPFYNDTHKEFVEKIFNSGTYDKHRIEEFVKYTKYLMILDEIPEESLRIYKQCLDII
tara:strand:- start:629 stop:1771 length:1143 start_codon:yes stop_codon:yes gene_type:complete